jgi:hypothetical protein
MEKMHNPMGTKPRAREAGHEGDTSSRGAKVNRGGTMYMSVLWMSCECHTPDIVRLEDTVSLITLINQ